MKNQYSGATDRATQLVRQNEDAIRAALAVAPDASAMLFADGEDLLLRSDDRESMRRFLASLNATECASRLAIKPPVWARYVVVVIEHVVRIVVLGISTQRGGQA